ncbi:hypothetical protein RST01_15360 [Rummeliibacillus stabekisii]|nr:hypothetical protein RST01_15360 [Rummeliibacillus stabekisii]
MKFIKIVTCLLVFLVIVNLKDREVIASDLEITLKEAINIGYQSERMECKCNTYNSKQCG